MNKAALKFKDRHVLQRKGHHAYSPFPKVSPKSQSPSFNLDPFTFTQAKHIQSIYHRPWFNTHMGMHNLRKPKQVHIKIEEAFLWSTFARGRKGTLLGLHYFCRPWCGTENGGWGYCSQVFSVSAFQKSHISVSFLVTQPSDRLVTTITKQQQLWTTASS